MATATTLLIVPPRLEERLITTSRSICDTSATVRLNHPLALGSVLKLIQQQVNHFEARNFISRAQRYFFSFEEFVGLAAVIAGLGGIPAGAVRIQVE